MRKRYLHHLWTRIRPLNYWYFLAAFLISGVIALVALRQNNLTALRLRDEVLQADQQNGDVEAALKKLRTYVYGHMNTDLASPNGAYPPIQLKYRYERLLAAEKDRISTANTQIYNDAQKYCEQAVPQGLSGRGRVPCIQEYVDSHGLKEQPIPDAVYKFDFASPVWSPDLAGWSLVLTVVFGGLFLIRFGLERWLRYTLEQHI